MTNVYDIIIRPIITERSMEATDAKKYVFEVLPGATKPEIAEAVEKMFKVGDIYVKSDTQSAVLDDIEHPYEYLSRLQKITLDIKADIYYPNDLRPGENHGYNTKYKG